MDRICSWLNGHSERQLIIHKYDMPTKTVIQLQYQLAERRAKRDFLRYSSLADDKKANIEQRIHITGANIFEEIKDIAKAEGYKKYMKVLEQINSEEKESALV